MPSGDGVDVLVLGELNPDVLVYGVQAPLRFGQVETEVPDAQLRLGSSGAITASATARLGLASTLCAVVGDDPAGRLARDLLAREGVGDNAVLVRSGRSTGLTVVLNAELGDRAMLTATGAMSALTVADVDPALLQQAHHVHVSSLFLQRGLHDGLAELLEQARARGATTSLDTGWDPDEKWAAVLPLLAHTSYLLPNEAELTGIADALRRAGTAVADSTVDAARVVAGAGPDVVVKLGDRGGLYATVEKGWEYAGTPVRPVDTTGAGDNFDAGLLWAITRGLDEPSALVCAVTAGASAVRGIGGTGAMADENLLRCALDVRGADVRRLW